MFLFNEILTGNNVPPREDVVTHDYYTVLNIPPTATAAEIKRSFKTLARHHHPDRGGDERMFAMLREAYETLSDDKKRAQYDEVGDGGGDDFLFPEADPRRRTRAKTMVVELSLAEFYSAGGTNKKIPYARNTFCTECAGKGSTRTDVCPTCGGKGTANSTFQAGPVVFQKRTSCPACDGFGHVFAERDRCSVCFGHRTTRTQEMISLVVPAGAPDGHRVVFPSLADEEPGSETGDLEVILKQKKDARFHRMGSDLVASCRVSLAAALCGDAVYVQLPNERTLKLTGPQDYIVRPGDVARVAHYGMPGAHGQVRGDLFVELHVQFPASLAPRSRSLAKLILPFEENKTERPNDVEDNTWTLADAADLQKRKHAAREASRQREHETSELGSPFPDTDTCRQQ